MSNPSTSRSALPVRNLPYFLDPHTLSGEMQTALLEYLAGPLPENDRPIQHLFKHIPLSVSADRMVPRHGTVTPSGITSTATSFGTRTPNENTTKIFNSFRSLPDVETFHGIDPSQRSLLFVRSDDSVLTDIMLDRLERYLSRSPITQEYKDRSTARSLIQAVDQPLMRATSETAVQGKNLYWDGAFVNDFLHEPSHFAPDTGNIVFSVRNATQREAGTAIGDALISSRISDECACSVEDKPKFHHARMTAMYTLASNRSMPEGGYTALKGFFIERTPDDKYRTSLDPHPNSAGRSPISRSEAHVYIQATEQCYAYNTRFCLIHGHQGHQLCYLAKPNLLLISSVIEYAAGSRDSLTAAAVIVALCLPALPGEAGRLRQVPVPLGQELGLNYDAPPSAEQPHPTGLLATAPASGDVDEQMPLASSLGADNVGRSSARYDSLPPMASGGLGTADGAGPHPADTEYRPVANGRSSTTQARRHPTSEPLRNDKPKSLKLLFDLDMLAGEELSDFGMGDGWASIASALNGVRLDLVDADASTSRAETTQNPTTPRNPTVRTTMPSPPDSDGCASDIDPTSPPGLKQVVVSGAIQPVLTPPSSANLESEVTDVQYLSTGAIGHSFRGYLASMKLWIVLKVASVSSQDEIAKEASVYQCLRQRRGPAITPRCFGLYRTYPSGPLQTQILVTEDAGQGLDERHATWETLSVFEKCDLKYCMDSLHALGITHGDLQLRHIRISPYTLKLNLIDFSHSTLDADEATLQEEHDLVLELVE